MKPLVSIAVVALLSFGCGAKEPPSPTAEASRVRTVVNQLTTALENEDMNLLSQVMAHDPDMVTFGTDAGERWVGWDSLAVAAQRQFDSFEGLKLSVHDQVIKISASGSTAWFSEVADWDANVGGQPAQIIGSRITGVLEKRGDDWVCVQFHVSAPVAGQALPY